MLISIMLAVVLSAARGEAEHFLRGNWPARRFQFGCEQGRFRQISYPGLRYASLDDPKSSAARQPSKRARAERFGFAS